MSGRGGFQYRSGGNGGSTGGGSSGSVYSNGVDTIAALSAINDAALSNGTVVGVDSVGAPWQLDKQGTDSADGITVAATLSGTGRWYRGQPFDKWARKTLWYVNFTTGNDEAAGDVATPLLTIEEYCRRVRGQQVQTFVTVNLIGTRPGPGTFLTINIDFGDEAGGYSAVTFVGVRSAPIFSGSFSAVTAYDSATDTPDLVTDATIPVSWTASGLVDKIGIVTSGVALGSSFAVMRDQGAKQARVTRFFDALNLVAGQPVAGATYEVYNLSTRIEASVRVNTRGAGGVFFTDVDIGVSGSHDVFAVRGEVGFTTCLCRGINVNEGAIGFFTASLHLDSPYFEGYAFWDASGSKAPVVVRYGGTLDIVTDSMISGTSGVGVDIRFGSNLNVTVPLSVWNCTTDGIYCDSESSPRLTTKVFGSGNGGYGIRTKSGCTVTYVTKPTVTGALNDTIIAGAATAYGAVPATNAAELSAIRLVL